MSFTELFIRRPVMTTLVMAGILVFGLVAYRALPVSDLPARVRTHDAAYHRLFVEQPAFGAPLDANPRPYVERSPTTHARARPR